MCGRLVLTSSVKDKIADIFDGIDLKAFPPDRYNITPGAPLAVVANTESNRIQLFNWGFNSKSKSAARLLINARAETVHVLPSFKDAFINNRCIIPAQGFYEWKREGSASRPQPYYFHMREKNVMLLAGLWQPPVPECPPESPSGCLVITTESNSLMHAVHDRMPVIFSPDSARLWLSSDAHPETLKAMLQPYPSGAMDMHAVSFRVNQRQQDDQDLIKPVRVLEQTSLF